MCVIVSMYLYHVLEEVSEVVFLVDKYLDVPTRIRKLWHTGYGEKDGGAEGERERERDEVSQGE